MILKSFVSKVIAQNATYKKYINILKYQGTDVKLLE